MMSCWVSWISTKMIEPLQTKMVNTRMDGKFSSCSLGFNTLRPRQNGCHFADDIFKCIFLNGNAWIPIKISLKFVPKGSVINIPTLVQIMAWGLPGDKPLSEPMMVNFTMHICIPRPQWDKPKNHVWEMIWYMPGNGGLNPWRVISVQLGQYHGCWCPGSLRRQDINSHDIDYRYVE